MIHSYKNSNPSIHETAFIAKDAVVIGDVKIDEYASIWFKTVIRGDIAPTISPRITVLNHILAYGLKQ